MSDPAINGRVVVASSLSALKSDLSVVLRLGIEVATTRFLRLPESTDKMLRQKGFGVFRFSSRSQKFL